MPKKSSLAVKPEDAPKSFRTRERILDSAAYVLSRKGYAGTRLTDVADHAELQAPAIYYYFKSREELIEEVMFTGIERLRVHMREVLDALPPETTPIERILAAVEAHLRYDLTVSDYTKASTRNSGQLPEQLRTRHDKERAAYGDTWRELFKTANEAGELDPDLDLRSARMLVIGAVSWAAEWWNPKSGSLNTVVNTAKIIVRNGLSKPMAVTTTATKQPAATRARRTKSTLN